MASLPSVAHHELRGRDFRVDQKRLDGLVVGQVNEQLQRLEQISETGLVSLQPALQDQGGFVPAVDGEQAGCKGAGISQELTGLIGQTMNLLRRCHRAVACELRVQGSDPVKQVTQPIEIGLQGLGIRPRVLAGQIPGGTFDHSFGGHQRTIRRRDWRACRSRPSGSSSRGSSSL